MSSVATNPFSEIDGLIAPPTYGCTVVTLLPYSFVEDKPHILPSTFAIPAAPEGGINILHVGEAIHYVPQAFDDKSIKQTTSPREMARSIVDDYSNSHICLAEGAGPGLFWVDGLLTISQVLRHHKEKVDNARERQKNWFHNLVSMADADWQRNHNMLAVSDLQRIAARSLGIVKDWVEFRALETKQCPYCKAPIDPTSVKCLNCHEVVDVVRYKQMQAELGGK